MRYAKDSDCCDSPEAGDRSVTASLSPAGIASRRLVSCFLIKGGEDGYDVLVIIANVYKLNKSTNQCYLTFLWTELHSRMYVTIYLK